MMGTETGLDGTRTEYFEVECAEPTLLALLRELFEEHWGEVIFGPCIEGAVFEGRFVSRPRVSLLDGYVTVQVDGDEGDGHDDGLVPALTDQSHTRRVDAEEQVVGVDGVGALADLVEAPPQDGGPG